MQFEGRLADGIQAGRRPVAVVLEPAGLRLLFPDGPDGAGIFWPFEEIRILRDEAAGGPLRLARADARLSIEAAEFRPALQAAAPVLATGRRRERFRLGAGIGVAVAAALGIWFGLPAAAGALAPRIPIEWEEDLGRRTLAMLVDARCTAPEGTRALDHLVARLAAASAHAPVPRVVVAQDDAVNAFALPGGRIVVFSGLIRNAASADELAGVLAHEFAHVRRRHVTAGLIERLGIILVLHLVTGSGGSADAAAWLVQSGFDRDKEREADADAVALLAAAGISTAGLADFFERIAGEAGGYGAALPAFVSTHPAPAERAAGLRAGTGTGPGGPALPDADWQALRGICGTTAR